MTLAPRHTRARRLARRLACTLPLSIGVVASTSRTAEAGGLEMPDHGSEALARGGAFTAKADDPTAVHYNVAGLAQQRGTRLFVGANASQSSLRFARAGVYPDDPANAATPWGGRPYPVVDNEHGPTVLPFVAATSDLGLSWMSVALAVHPPPSANYSGRTYPIAVNGAPSPVRYDTVGGTSSVILSYTGAIGLRLGEAVDLGFAVHLVQASLETRSVSYLDLTSSCRTLESVACDGRAESKLTGWSATGSIGALFRLGAGITAGVHVRGPVLLEATGESTSTSPRALGGAAQAPTVMALRTALPVVVRAGVRKSFASGADVEVDATYERWSDAQSPGPLARFALLGTTKNATVTLHHHYVDTFSVRAGGAYPVKLGALPLTLRAGMFYDASATESADTRVDADTLAKVAATTGLGARLGSFTVGVAYAAVLDVPRTVEDGAVRPINAAKGGASVDAAGRPLPAVNDGTYRGFTHVLSLGVTVELDELLGLVRARAPALGPRPPLQGRR